MIKVPYTKEISLPACALFLGSFPIVLAAPVAFNIDQSKTTAVCSGDVAVQGLGIFPLTTQATGSLTTAYSGTLLVEVTAGTVAFDAASLCSAQINGNWSPLSGGSAGTASGNYGGKVNAAGLQNVDVTVRNAAFNIASAAIPLSGTTFNGSSANFTFSSGGGGVLDYRATGISPKNGTRALTGVSSNGVSPNGSLVTSGTTQTLSLPVDTTYTLTLISTNDTTLHIKGMLVATRSIATVAGAPTQISISGDNITLSWPSTIGEKNRIESTPDLKTWGTLNGSLTSASTVTSYQTPKIGPVGYFRRVPLP